MVTDKRGFLEYSSILIFHLFVCYQVKCYYSRKSHTRDFAENAERLMHYVYFIITHAYNPMSFSATFR